MKLSVLFVTCLSLAAVTQAVPLHSSNHPDKRDHSPNHPDKRHHDKRHHDKRHHDKRRFGVEHTPEADATFQEVKDIVQGTDKEAQGGDLSGAMVRALLAKAPACDQQDRADEVIDLGNELGGDKRDQLVKVAQTYRQLERNTPNAGQPSELCKKPPKNKELDGLTQAQDPTGPKGKDPVDPEDPEDPPKGKDPEDPEDPPKGKDPEDPEDPPKGKDPEDPEDPPKKPKNPKKPKKPKNPEDPEDPPKGKDPEDPEDPEDPPKKPKNPKKPKKPKNPEDPEDPEDPPKGKDPEDPEDPEDPPKGKDPADGTNIAETDPVGGVKMPKIVQQNGDFIVNGNGFNGNLDNAHARQCDIQNNLCFNKFNAGDRTFSTEDCANQLTACKEGPPVFA